MADAFKEDPVAFAGMLAGGMVYGAGLASLTRPLKMATYSSVLSASPALQGVVTARQYVLLDYDVQKNLVDQACAITPGLESPTISPLQKADWVAVRAMVLRKETNRVMDELWALGARGILVTDIHACRL
jgi:ATP phosphoribosyltransferase-like protein